MKPSETRWSAVVLGGGDPGDTFASAHGVNVKSLIPIHSVPMAVYVLEALRQSKRLQRIAYVGPTSPEIEPLIDIRVTDHGTLLRNLEAGVEAITQAGLAANERVLVVTADIPMLLAEQLQEVLDQAPLHAGLVYPVVSRKDCEQTYPGVKRTFVKLKDDTFTGGNLFILDPRLIKKFLPRLREVLSARKAPFKLARIIGLSTLFKLLTGRLTVANLEKKVTDIVGVPAHALVTPHAAIGTDVDKESDLQLAIKYLKPSTMDFNRQR